MTHSDSDPRWRPETVLAHAGRPPEATLGAVNPPVYHVSTVLSPDVATLRGKDKMAGDHMVYGRYGTPTVFALEETVARLEGGVRCTATCSGLSAIAGTLLAVLKAGDHLLMVDSVYFPTRSFCDKVLAGFGVETTYYAPDITPDELAALIRPETRLLFTELPGSLTFEMQDLPALAEVARERGVKVAIDNTWGTPLYFKPFEKGADISIQAGTKYIVGHSDAMLGTITTADEALGRRIKETVALFGYSVGSDEAYLALRGLRTLSVRLARHHQTGLALAEWLEGRPEVARVLHPALPSDPGHALWKRDFSGACGLFGVVLKAVDEAKADAMLDRLTLFGLGFSWGGYESLAIPTYGGSIVRTVRPWQAEGPTLRLHAGLEDPADLIADLEQGLACLAG
ncbi:cystathionine beta-lyase [Roseospirillum parvum]|uniref:Cystathionine beta-lyase n=1 Tax=Roseospirillum parvum TaxID=83401 RepID=A0A1G8EVA1_9PROT|nr:cystathionine beta-lyase [Roseospirillum parvum]SDH73639.1 cystathionine beta-lyase [Roseospirillum parvum]